MKYTKQKNRSELIKAPEHPPITPESVYLNRRKFMGRMATGSVALALMPGAILKALANTTGYPATDKPTELDAITGYNNFYEFTTDKERVSRLANNFETSPWTVDVDGLVERPGKFNVPDLVREYEPEERVYRLRCVEGWSMVIPWMGFSLARLLDQVGPKKNARFVKFIAVYRPEQLPGQRNTWYTWPYVEGLRLDEAMHNLTILATGLYGKLLLPQNGAPIRLVVPWKYGFKSIKSIVKIELVEEQPTSLWMAAAPREYGFYANVNPQVAHPRWSQASERRIGEFRRRKTLLFNGYEEQVAQLYGGMDLEADY